MAGEVLNLTEENFNEAIKAKEPVIIDFWAEWCGPCKKVAPLVDEIAKKYTGQIKVYKLNVDNAQDTASHYQVMSIPTLIFMKNGEEVDRIVGAVSRNAIDEKVRELI
ncbi:MAG: thioredoxin [Candidatus Omnitrophica bacterium]|nr:thioredoxin [Candidatus Omnitrophota bacterium]